MNPLNKLSKTNAGQELCAKGHMAPFALLLLLAIVLTACNGAAPKSPADDGPFTGFLEGDHLDVAALVGGRITSVTVEEGDEIAAGKALVSLEDDLVRSRITLADANVAVAQSQLALLQAGARLEDLNRAQAKVDQAKAALASASQALADLQAIRSNPQALIIAQAQAAVRYDVAAQNLIAVQRQADAADEINTFWETQTRSLWEGVNVRTPDGTQLHFDVPMRAQTYSQEQWQKAGNAMWQAWAAVAPAQASVDAAAAGVADATDQVNNPITLDTRVDSARADRDRATASVDAAQAALQQLKDGATPAQLRSAQAAVDEARSARATLDRDLTNYVVAAPDGGTVNRVYYRLGEVVSPGAALVQLTLAKNLTLRVYVPMPALDGVQIGRRVTLRVEGLDRSYAGQVSRIGDRAEFSGRQSQNDSDRNAQLVQMEISVDTNGDEIKPGMPATVSLR